MKDNNIKRIMLNIQYKINIKISNFISSVFYDNQLEPLYDIKIDHWLHFIYSVIKYENSFSFIIIQNENFENESNKQEVEVIFQFV